MIWRLLWRAILWHGLGILLGGFGLGVGYYIALALDGPDRTGAMLGALYMGIFGLIAFTAFTPVAVVLLAVWSYGAARLPSLESPSLFRRLLVLSGVAVLLTAPVTIGTMLVTGMDNTRDGQTGMAAVRSVLIQDWRVLLIFLPASLGWFVAPRILAPSLWGRFAIEKG